MKKLVSLLRFSLLGLFTLGFINISFAQMAPAKQWDRTYGAGGSDQLKMLCQTSDGGYILGGNSDSGMFGDKSQASKGGDDYWVIKLDAFGNKIWDRTFGGTGSDILYSLQQTLDGGYILGGASNSAANNDKSQNAQAGSDDYWIIKLNASGNKVWDKTFGGNNPDILQSLHQTLDGGYILGGYSDSGMSGDKSEISRGNRDYWVIKLDVNGNKTWDKTFGGSGFEVLHSLQQTVDGGYILGGYSTSGIGGDKSQVSLGYSDYWIVKLNASGNKVWDKIFGGNDTEIFSWLQQTVDGGFILGGSSISNIGGGKSQVSKGSNDYWIVKLDANGNQIWDKTLGGNNDDYFSSLQQTSDGGYILGGYSWSGISGDKSEPTRSVGAFALADYWIVKLDANGIKIWDKTLGGAFHDYCYSLQQTSDESYILGGSSESDLSGDKSENNKGFSDYWVVKLGADVLGTGEALSIQGNKLFQNQPNPFSKNTTISFNLAQPEEIELTIYNSLGQTVAKHQKKYDAGKHQVQWNELVTGKNLKAGTYFYQLSAGDFRDTKRMILLD